MTRIAQFAYGTLSYAIFYAGRLEERDLVSAFGQRYEPCQTCLLYTSDAADE